MLRIVHVQYIRSEIWSHCMVAMHYHVHLSSHIQKRSSAAWCLNNNLKYTHLAKSPNNLPASTYDAPKPHTFGAVQGCSALQTFHSPCKHYIAGKHLHLSQSVGLLQSDFARLLDPSIHLQCMFVCCQLITLWELSTNRYAFVGRVANRDS